MASKDLIVLVTGSSRGIGLGLVKEFISRGGYKVIATCRHPASASDLGDILKVSNNADAVACDVGNDDSIRSCKEVIEKLVPRIDILVNNAGIATKNHPHDPPSEVNRSEFLSVINTNVAGVCAMTQTFLPLLLKSQEPKVVTISSRLGSVQLADRINSTSYRCSKAAVNMLVKVFAVEFPQIAFLSISPGWVATDMGSTQNRKASLTVSESTKCLFDAIVKLDNSSSGKFLEYSGEELPY